MQPVQSMLAKVETSVYSNRNCQRRGALAKSDNKTQPTRTSVQDFLDTVRNEKQRADAQKIAAMLTRISRCEPKMWGPSIIGFGSYHYKYDSGRQGETCRIGFSPRKGKTVFYIVNGFDGYSEHMEKLGNYKTGKSCLYIKQLCDVDQTILEQLCAASLEWMAEKYPE